MQKSYSLTETCSTENACTPRELYQKDDPTTRRHPPEYKPIEAEGFNGCAWCKRPFREALNQCPECNRYFFGPKNKQGYPRRFKFAIECEACE